MVVPVCAVFILIILAMIASIFGDPRAPVTQWLDRHGGTLLMVTFSATMVLALLAMTVDRIRTLRAASGEVPGERAAADEAPGESADAAEQPGASQNTSNDSQAPTQTNDSP